MAADGHLRPIGALDLDRVEDRRFRNDEGQTSEDFSPIRAGLHPMQECRSLFGTVAQGHHFGGLLQLRIDNSRPLSERLAVGIDLSLLA